MRRMPCLARTALLAAVVVWTAPAAAQGPGRLAPSANRGRTGTYRADTANPAYHYWVCVPSTYSAERPAGLYIFFHGQFNSNGADNFWVAGGMLEAHNLVGINMEYTDGNYLQDAPGKLAAAEQAVLQTMADYKIVQGRGVMASFSGGGIIHNAYFNRHGAGGPRAMSPAWCFCTNALYSTNYRGPAGGGWNWLVCLHEEERMLAGLGTSQTRVAADVLRESLAGGAAEAVFFYAKGLGHGVTDRDTAWASRMFGRTDLAIAPFVYAADYPEPPLAPAVTALGRLAYGPAEAALKKLVAAPQTPAELRAKAEKLLTAMSERADRIVAMGKGLAADDPILCAAYARLIIPQFTGHSRRDDVQAAFGPGVQRFTKERLATVKEWFLSAAPGLVDLASGKVSPAHRESLARTIAAAGKESEVGRMAQALLDCVP